MGLCRGVTKTVFCLMLKDPDTRTCSHCVDRGSESCMEMYGDSMTDQWNHLVDYVNDISGHATCMAVAYSRL